MSESSTLISYSGKISGAELAQVPTSPATASHVPIPHIEVVENSRPRNRRKQERSYNRHPPGIRPKARRWRLGS
jgi:hypothetical protein